jgi:hypothetical protein
VINCVKMYVVQQADVSSRLGGCVLRALSLGLWGPPGAWKESLVLLLMAWWWTGVISCVEASNATVFQRVQHCK